MSHPEPLPTRLRVLAKAHRYENGEGPLHEAAARIETLTAALGKLEKANEKLAAQRSVRTYDSIVQDGAAELLMGLDTARAEARKLLTQRN